MPWADPEENFRSLVPAVRMLWAALGVVRPPDAGARVAGVAVPPRTIWRFVEGTDTLDYVATDSSPRTLEAEWRREGKVLARSRTELDGRAQPTKARIDFPEARARFELTVVGVDTAAVFARTAGGVIEVDQSTGLVSAQNSGGAIQVNSAKGVRCESDSGGEECDRRGDGSKADAPRGEI